MNPIDNPDAYFLLVAGVNAPGVCTILEADSDTQWDDKEASAQTGATTTYIGRKLRAFKSRHSLIVDPIDSIDEITEWESFAQFVESSSGGDSPKALDVWHPDLATQGITSATKRNISALQHDGYGGATAEIHWKEYAPPKPKSAKGVGGSKTGDGTQTYGDKKVADRQAEIDALLAEGDP